MVIPVADRNPLRRTPVVTLGLILANVVVFLVSPAGLHDLGASGAKAACDQAAFLQRWGAVPSELVGHAVARLVPGGPTPDGQACFAVMPAYHKTPVLSAFTAMFVHAGWAHLLGNMLFLWVFGNNIEDRMGRLKFLVFYLAAGLVATYGFALFSQNSKTPLVGASGAIAAVLGAYLIMYPRARVWSLVPFLLFLPLPLPAWLVLGLWFVVQWVYASGAGLVGTGGVAYAAHVVGFVLGVVVALIFYGRQPLPDRRVRARAAPPPGW